MSYLVRKIAISKWNPQDLGGPVNADAITNCMKTSANTLSVWRIDSIEALQDGVLAVAASLDHIAKLDFVVLDEGEIIRHGIEIAVTPGKTACDDLVGLHRDLANLNIESLAVLSGMIAEKIRANQSSRYTVAKVKLLLEDAVKRGRIDAGKLKEDVRNKLAVA